MFVDTIVCHEECWISSSFETQTRGSQQSCFKKVRLLDDFVDYGNTGVTCNDTLVDLKTEIAFNCMNNCSGHERSTSPEFAQVCLDVDTQLVQTT